MRDLLRMFRIIWAEDRAAMLRGLILSVAVLAAGAALLGLSGWFITAAGAAGLAGIGIAFDVFRPSAGVRFLAIGRTAARYGERVLTHDATLRALARLRVRLLDRLSQKAPTDLAALRGSEGLNRLTADVDALDGIAIRLAFPVLAGAVTLVAATALVWWLTAPAVALAMACPLLVGAGIVLWITGRAGIAPSERGEAARQALRRSSIDHLRGRTMLAFAGDLARSRDSVLDHDHDVRAADRTLARLDRIAGAVVGAASLVAVAGTLLIGGTMALDGDLSPARVAIAVFAALALGETIAPFQRGVAEIGRMRSAVGRVLPLLRDAANSDPRGVPPFTGPGHLALTEVTVSAPGTDVPLFAPLSLTLTPGETVALTGPSGRGKTTLLGAIAGVTPPLAGQIRLDGQDITTLPESALRAQVGFLPQRPALLSGTIRDALNLGAPDAADADMQSLLDALGLWRVIAPKGGLDMYLGEAGNGLSGGESRRLALARTLLRKPKILLLDEPTEGLDPPTAAKVLSAVRTSLPRSAILLATHKPGEIAACDKKLTL